MSIAKFSNDVVLIFPPYRQVSELDTSEQQRAFNSVENVIRRLERLGISDAHIMADNSLAVEGYNTLQLTNINTHIYDVLPPTSKNIILNHMIGDNEERNKLIEGTFPCITEPFNKDSLTETENTIMGILNTSFSDLMQNESLPHERKVRIILMVMALSYFRLDFDEKDLMDYDAELVTFLHSTMKTEEEMIERIEKDMDYYWEWANEILEKNRSKRSNYSLFAEVEALSVEPSDSDYDDIDKQTQEIMLALNALEYGNKTVQDVQSEMSISLNNSTISSRISSRNEVIESSLTEERTPTLYEALQTMSSTDINQNAELRAQLNMLVKEVEQYMILNAKALKSRYNLIVNFFVSQNTRLFKAMDVTDENKILLNVDLKSGIVDVIFKGRPFKLNGFFMQGEVVKVNALEW